MTRKEKIKMRDRLKVINARFAEMDILITKDKRSLTEEENKEKDDLKNEKQSIELRLLQDSISVPGEENTTLTNARAFDEIVNGIAKRNVPEEYRHMVNEDMNIELRAGEVQNSGSVGAITPLNIGTIIEPLEKGLILGKVGVKMQYGMSGSWQFPIVAGVVASIVGEDVAISDSKINIDKITPSPKRVSLKIPVTYQAENRSAGIIMPIVVNQMVMGVTRTLNSWMFSQTKQAGTEGGCFVEPKTELTATGNAWKDALALKGQVMSTGIVFDDTAAYVCSATKYAELESTPRDAGSGLMVIENGKINGYPVFMTEFIGDGVLGFGVFSYMLVGQFGTMRFVVDPFTQADKDRIVFTLNTEFDMLPLRKEAFGILKDKAPAGE
ncbi:phage major capsid protein [Bacteroides propionicifaciens]|uniref:phage major capsid protein n=1 Tax=Bacteroides propionicifaciens TaxID=392838 RepID=UPI0003803FF5|nr:phage major capsid protein [Bacteroides propionicifaciens]